MTPTRCTRRAAALAATAAALLHGPMTLAQDKYPSKPITIVVPYPAGGSNDVFARMRRVGVDALGSGLLFIR